MKLAFFILCAFGTASAKFLIKPGSEQVYAYSGRILSGIPELENVFSGLAIDCKVLLQAGQGLQPGTNTFKVALKDVQFSNFNQKLNGPMPLNWRTMVTPATTPVTNTYRNILESPVEFEMVNWEVKKVIISSEEPEWSVNFKKALISSIKMQLPQGDEQQNRISRGEESWMGITDGSIHSVPEYWSVMEQGIDGVCENTYQVTELPEYMISEVERNLIKREQCMGKKIYQVVRTRDITKCTSRSLFVASRGHKNCLMGHCNGASGKSSSTRYLGCGENKESFQLHAVINEGEHQQNLLAFNTEKVVTGTKQVLALQEVRLRSSQLPSILAPRTVEDLLYEYPKEATAEQKKHITNYKKQQEFFRDQARNPRDQVFRPDGKPKPMDQNMKQRILQKLTQVAADLREIEHFGKKQVTAVLHTLKNILSIRNEEELKSLYSEVKGRETERKLFIDTILMSGSNPGVMFLKEIIINNELSFMEKVDVIIALPHNIKAPSPKLLEELYQLVTSPAIISHKALKANAHLAYATIINRACFQQYDLAAAMFPEDVLGKMCHANKDHIVSQFIAHLQRELQGQDAQVAIMALGALDHKSAISILIPYIEGRASGSQAQNIDIRKMAIYSLSQVSNQHRNTLLPVYAALVHNPSENRDIRIAAFSIMLGMDPSAVHLQKIAVSTWFEKDDQVAKYVYSSLKSLSQIKRSQIPNDSKVFALALKAATVLPLAKPFPGVISSNFNTFFADILKELQVGYQGQAAMINSPNSHTLYFKLNMFLKQVKYTPIEFAAQVHGIKNIVIEALKSVTSDSKGMVHRELEKIIEKLEISPRDESPVQADFWASIHNDIQVFIQTPQVNAEYIKEKMKSVLKLDLSLEQETKRKLCGKTTFHVNKVFEVLPYVAVVPSDMGFPIVIETHNTHLVSMNGEVDVDCAQGLPSVTLESSLKTAHSWSGYAGTVSPFQEQREELLAAGIDVHNAVNFPVHAVLRLEPRSGSLKVEMKQVKQVTQQTNNVDLIHVHVLPFTAKKPLIHSDVTPIILDRTNTKILKSVAPKKDIERKMDQSLGLDLKFKVETESDLFDRKDLMDRIRNYRYNPLVAAALANTGTALKADGSPSIRYHKVTLVHNPQNSNTKEMRVDIKVSAARQEKREIIQHIASGSEKRIRQEQKLSQTILKLRSSNAFAANALVEISLIGGSRKTFSYSVTAAKGSTEQEHKWNLDLESEAEPGMVCVSGSMELPVSRESRQKLRYRNRVGFGATCEEYFVNVDGFTATSENQIEVSRRSEARRECERLGREEEGLYQRIQTQPQGERKVRMEQEPARLSYRKMEYCEEQRKEETSLDKVEIDITTSPRLPPRVYTIAKYLNSGLKGFLYQYIAGLPSIPRTANPAVKVFLDFNQRLNTVTMRVSSPVDSTLYKDIRIPRMVRDFLPMSYSRSVLDQSHKALFGSSLRSRCSISRGLVRTFDKKTYSYRMDDCNHLVASDCSPSMSHAVLAKEKDNVKHVTIYSGETVIVLAEPVPRYSGEQYSVEVDGRRVGVLPSRSLKVGGGSCSILWSLNAIEVDTPAHRVIYDGRDLIVEEKPLAGGQTCGLCGDNNQDRRGDLQSPKQCLYKSIQSMVHSYRVPDSQCISRISTTDRNILKQQQSQCTVSNTVKQQQLQQQKQQQLNSKQQQQQLYGQRSGGQKGMKHAVLYNAGEICISKESVAQCGSHTMARDIEKKEVEFVCRPSIDREIKVWERMAKEGALIQQLRREQASFKSQVELPGNCVRNY